MDNIKFYKKYGKYYCKRCNKFFLNRVVHINGKLHSEIERKKNNDEVSFIVDFNCGEF